MSALFTVIIIYYSYCYYYCYCHHHHHNDDDDDDVLFTDVMLTLIEHQVLTIIF